MVGETVSIDQMVADAGTGDKREQSTIAFPYLGIDAGEEVGKAVYARSGFGSCDLDELAAEMGQVISGAFRLKTGAAKTFDIIDKDGRSSVKLTDLGKDIINPDTARAARVEAFMRVPLYAAVYDKYKGQRLPPMKALEREMQALGVARKQTDKARQAFERSARQAGFFEAGDDRLVRPKVELPAAKVEVPAAEQGRYDEAGRQHRQRHAGGGDGPQDPLLVGLVNRLPEPGSSWDGEARATWLRLAVSIFDMVYQGGGAEITVTAKPQTAMEKMAAHMKTATD